MSVEPIGDRRRFERLPGSGYVYELLDEPLRIEVRYLRRVFGQLHAEVDVRCEWAGVRHHNGSLSCADLNLSNQTARSALGKHCAHRAKTKPDEFDWEGVIDATCLHVIQAERSGETSIVLDDAPLCDARDAEVLGLYIPTDATSMIIAHGDTLKSLVLLTIAGTQALRGERGLFCDWEWTADRHKQRKQRLFGADRIDGLRYLKCRGPLTVEADRIRRECDQHGIGRIYGDSVAPACSDGKLSDDDTATRFHRAASTLPPSLWTAHVPKSTLTGEKADAVGPFGSVFFSNLCRSTWLVKKQIGADENIATVALTPMKQNDGDRRHAVGLEFTFSPSRIAYRPVDLLTVDGLSDKMPLALRMASVLKRGPMTIALLANELDAKPDSIEKAAKRSQTFTKVLGPDGIQRIALVERRVA